jgi:hypothetical protein
VGLQVVVAFLRPDPGTWLRETLWNPIHKTGGRAITLTAWAAVVTGIIVHHESLYRAPIVPWIVPLAVVMGLMLLGDSVLRDIGAKRPPAAPAGGTAPGPLVNAFGSGAAGAGPGSGTPDMAAATSKSDSASSSGQTQVRIDMAPAAKANAQS